jgi:hypothetical protein
LSFPRKRESSKGLYRRWNTGSPAFAGMTKNVLT